jgi:hypothetical protein
VQLFVEMVSDLSPLLEGALGSGAGGAGGASGPDADSSAVSTQTALLCIDTLGRAFAADHSAEFKPIVKVMMKFVDTDGIEAGAGEGAGVANKQVLSTVFLCLSTLCSESGPLLLPYIPRLVPRLLDSFELTCHDEGGRGDGEVGGSSSAALVLLQQSTLTSLSNIVQKLPSLFHPYLARLVTGLCHPSILPEAGSDSRSSSSSSQQVADTHTELCRILASAVEPRHMIPSVTQAYRACTGHGGGPSSVSQLLGVLSDALGHLKTSDVAVHYAHVFKFLLVVMGDGHITYAGGREGGGAVVADALAETFLAFVMKLNETQLR